MFGPTALLVEGRFLIVAGDRSNPHLVVLDRDSGTVISTAAPNDTSSGGLRHVSALERVAGARGAVQAIDERSGLIQTYQLSQGGVLTYRSRTELTANTALNRSQTRGFVESVATPVWTGGHYIANGFFVGRVLVSIDTAGGLERALPLRPPFDTATIRDAFGRFFLNLNYLTVAPSGIRAAIVYKFANRVDIVDRDGRLAAMTSGPHRLVVQWRYNRGRRRTELAPGAQDGFGDVTSSDRFVYALFCGCPIDSQLRADNVQVFDWSGALVAEFTLGRPVDRIAVSPNDDFIYGVTADPDTRGIDAWRLPRLTR